MFVLRVKVKNFKMTDKIITFKKYFLAKIFVTFEKSKPAQETRVSFPGPFPNLRGKRPGKQIGEA